MAGTTVPVGWCSPIGESGRVLSGYQHPLLPGDMLLIEDVTDDGYAVTILNAKGVVKRGWVDGDLPRSLTVVQASGH